MEVFVGMIAMFGFNFTPRGWAPCNGQALSIAQNQALFSLLSTQFGGDGRNTFNLPDLRGRVPMHFGQGPGLSNYTIGQRVGQESGTLTVDQMPSHNHTASATSTLHAESAQAGAQNPQGNLLAAAQVYAPEGEGENRELSSESVLTDVTVAPAGGGQGVDLRQPSLAVNYCIALQGIYPSRD